MGACQEFNTIKQQIDCTAFSETDSNLAKMDPFKTGHWNTMVQKYLSPSYNISWCISARNILFQKYIRLFQIILRLVLRQTV